MAKTFKQFLKESTEPEPTGWGVMKRGKKLNRIQFPELELGDIILLSLSEKIESAGGKRFILNKGKYVLMYAGGHGPSQYPGRPEYRGFNFVHPVTKRNIFSTTIVLYSDDEDSTYYFPK